MPHYKDGRPAKVGDLVKTVAEASPKVVGRLVSVMQSNGGCNGQVLVFARDHGDGVFTPSLPQYPDCVTLSQMLPLEAIEQGDKVEAT